MGITPLNRAIFLDRDGVLNRALVRHGRPYPPRTISELEILPGVPEALVVLQQAGYRLLVVTNQPDIARGQLSSADLWAIHHRLQTMLRLDAIYVCPHDDADRCTCRKPLPGLLHEAACAWSINLSASYMVGDRWRDIEAGRMAGCRTILVDYEYDEALYSEPDLRVASLLEAATWILSQDRQRTIQT